jgi:thymidylate synthase
MKKGKAPPKKYYTSSGRRRKIGSWSYIKNHGVREWAKNKEREILAGTEKKIGDAGHVYIFSLGHDGLYKVGRTYNIEKRLKALQAANPLMRCVWSAWVKDMREAERILHKQFQAHRLDREIFQLTSAHILHANQVVNNMREGYEVH